MALSASSQAMQEVREFGLHPYVFIAVPATCVAICSIVVPLRVYVRVCLLQRFGLDDWLLLFAFTIYAVDCALGIACGYLQATGGLIQDLNKITSVTIAAELIYLVDQIAVKLALAAFFLRFVRETWQRRTIQISVAIYTLYATAFCILCIFQCGTPLPQHFEFPANCIPWTNVIGPMNYIAAINNCIIDWILTFMPLFTVAHTMMSARQKVSVCALILLGLSGSIISIVRIPFVRGIRLTGELTDFHAFVPVAMLSIAESGIGIITMSLAALRPLVTRAVLASSYGSRTGRTRTAGTGMGTVDFTGTGTERKAGSKKAGVVEMEEMGESVVAEKGFGGITVMRTVVQEIV